MILLPVDKDDDCFAFDVIPGDVLARRVVVISLLDMVDSVSIVVGCAGCVEIISVDTFAEVTGVVIRSVSVDTPAEVS